MGTKQFDGDEAVRRGAFDLRRLLRYCSQQTQHATDIPELERRKLCRERLIAVADEGDRCRRVDARLVGVGLHVRGAHRVRVGAVVAGEHLQTGLLREQLHGTESLRRLNAQPGQERELGHPLN